MFSSTLILLAPLALFAQNVVATNPVIQVPLFGYGSEYAVEGSVLAVNNGVTTMALACPSASKTTDCYMFARQTLTIGASTYRLNFRGDGGHEDNVSGFQDCKVGATVAVDAGFSFAIGVGAGTVGITAAAHAGVTGAASAVNAQCTVSADGDGEEYKLHTTSSYGAPGSDADGRGAVFQVTVVAGANLLTAAATQAATATGIAAQTGSGVKTTGAVQTGGIKVTGTAPAGTAASSQPSTGQASQLGLKLALGVVAAGVAGLLAL
jgi:hypothetical protein